MWNWRLSCSNKQLLHVLSSIKNLEKNQNQNMKTDENRELIRGRVPTGGEREQERVMEGAHT